MTLNFNKIRFVHMY